LISDRDEVYLTKQQTVRTKIPKQPMPVLVDRNMVRVIFNNLFDNATKFTPEEGRITVSIEQHGNETWTIVKDTGIGIPEDQLNRIFNRFYQLEPHLSRQYEGMGLGLAIAKELAELNRGRIWADSVLGEGSQFYVAFPTYENES
jgi:signal transduction histidine kinase